MIQAHKTAPQSIFKTSEIMKHFYDPRTSTTSNITRSGAGLAKSRTMHQHQQEPLENSPKNTNAQKDGVRGSGGLVSLCCGTTRGFRSGNQDPSDSRHEEVTVYRDNEARHVGSAAPSGTVNHDRSTKTPHEPRVSPPPLMIPRIMGPPKIHRITSSSPRPSLTYERIGNPCLGIFKLSLPRRLTQTLHGIVAHAENHVAMTHPNGSWKTELYSVTRQDVALRKIPGMATRIEPIVDYITRAMQALYGCHRVHMDRNQPHILKYSVDTGHTGVQLHHDRCDITANLVLSRSDEYVGGGTYFPQADGKVVRLEQGDFLLHPGPLLHGGMDIKNGTRFLMVLFAHLKFD